MLAQVTEVKIGHLSINGLLLEDGSFAVSVQQAASLFQVRQDNTQRNFKALLGGNSRFVKIRVKNAQTRKEENCLTLVDFERLLGSFDRKGNKTAQALVG